MSTLFTNEEPKPYGEYPPTGAYVVILLLGLIPFSFLLTAPGFAFKYPGVGWRWGLWAFAPTFLLMAVATMRSYGFLAGLIGTVANPFLWIAAAFCCLLAFAAARWSARQ